MVVSWPSTLMDQGPHGYVWISYSWVYLWWKIIYKPNKTNIYLKYHLWKTFLKISALHTNLCNFMILCYYSCPHLLLLVKNWIGCTQRIHRMLLTLQRGVGTWAGWCCAHIGNNDHLMHRLHENYAALQSQFQTFQRVRCFADSSLNPTVLQHFIEIRTWHRKLVMWINRYLSSISSIKDVLNFYFFLKVLFIWTQRQHPTPPYAS